MRATSYTVARRFALIVAFAAVAASELLVSIGIISESAAHAMRRVPEMGKMTDIPLPPPKSSMLIIILFAIAGAVVLAIAYCDGVLTPAPPRRSAVWWLGVR